MFEQSSLQVTAIPSGILNADQLKVSIVLTFKFPPDHVDPEFFLWPMLLNDTIRFSLEFTKSSTSRRQWHALTERDGQLTRITSARPNIWKELIEPSRLHGSPNQSNDIWFKGADSIRSLDAVHLADQLKHQWLYDVSQSTGFQPSNDVPGITNFKTRDKKKTQALEEFGAFFESLSNGPEVHPLTRSDDIRLSVDDIQSEALRIPKLSRDLGFVVDLVLPVPIDLIGRSTGLMRAQIDGELTWLSMTSNVVAFDMVTNDVPPKFLPKSDPSSLSQSHVGLVKLCEEKEDDDPYRFVTYDLDAAGFKELQRQTDVTEANDYVGPARKSGGIFMLEKDAAQSRLAYFTRLTAVNAQQLLASADTVQYAQDLEVGWKIDVKRDDTPFLSLHNRRSTLFPVRPNSEPLAGYISTINESFFQRADQSGTSSTSVYQAMVHGNVLAWNGFSLSAPQPTRARDKAWEQQRKGEDSNSRLYSDESHPLEGSLPPLRFGSDYRIRIRRVFANGASINSDEADAIIATPTNESLLSRKITFRRWEPAGSPIAIASSQLTRGETAQKLVVRREKLTTASTRRFLFPPGQTEDVCDWMGAFDNYTPDEQYDIIEQRLGKKHAEYQRLRRTGDFRSGWTRNVPYLPDPAVEGLYFHVHFKTRRQQAYQNGSSVDTTDLGLLEDSGWISFSKYLEGRVAFKVSFYDQDSVWPNACPIEVRLLASNARASRFRVIKSAWGVRRRVEVELAAGEWIQFSATSAIFASEKNKFELYGASESAMQIQSHPMVSPPVQLDLLHCTEVPVSVPSFTSPKFARNKGSLRAQLVDQIVVDGATTSALKLYANWSTSRANAINDDATTKTDDAVSKNVPVEPESVVLDSSIQSGDANPLELTMPDLKARKISVRLEGTSRYYKYFPEDPNERQAERAIAISSVSRYIWIPSAAPPPPPSIHSVLPAFEWVRHHGNEERRRSSLNTSIRIYLNAPWEVSGEEEMLAVVCPHIPHHELQREDREFLSSYTSIWGRDPLLVSAELPPGPFVNHFPLAEEKVDGIRYADESRHISGVYVSGAMHAVLYDDQQQLWYSDVRIDVGDTYRPWVRLALARYQRHAIDGCAISPIVAGTYVQVLNNRVVIVSTPTEDPGSIDIIVSGSSALSGVDADGPRMDAVIQVNSFGKLDVGWQNIKTIRMRRNGGLHQTGAWVGRVRLQPALSGHLRLQVREYIHYPQFDPQLGRARKNDPNWKNERTTFFENIYLGERARL